MKTMIDQIKVYMANDGTMFRRYDDCKNHETKINDMTILSNTEMVITYYDVFDNEYNDNKIKVLWYKPKNESELNAINNYYKTNISKTAINRWICIHITDIHSNIDDYSIEMCPFDLFSKFTIFDSDIEPKCFSN